MRWFCAASIAALLLITSSVHAEGQGKGLGRALSKVGKGNASQGLSKAGKGLSQAGSGLGRAGALSRAPGVNRAGTEKIGKGSGPLGGVTNDQATRHVKQLEIEQRNMEKRIAQAQKLREQAELNGDAELAANADRMEAQAIKHYEDRVAHLESKFGVTDPNLAPPTVDVPLEGELSLESPVVEGSVGVEVAPAPTTTREAAVGTETATRPWWKPKWLGGK